MPSEYTKLFCVPPAAFNDIRGEYHSLPPELTLEILVYSFDALSELLKEHHKNIILDLQPLESLFSSATLEEQFKYMQQLLETVKKSVIENDIQLFIANNHQGLLIHQFSNIFKILWPSQWPNPLNEHLILPTRALTHRLELRYWLSKGRSRNQHHPFILPIGDPLSVKDLYEELQEYSYEIPWPQIILVLTGEHYRENEHRQSIIEQLKILLRDPLWSCLVHVFLIPNLNNCCSYYFSGLKFCEIQEGCQVLTRFEDIIGYYLTDTSLFEQANARRLDEMQQTPSNFSKLIDLTQQRDTLQENSKKTTHSTPYIISTDTPGPQYRLSKKQNPKENLTLNYHHSIGMQQNFDQTQEQQQQQEQEQQQQNDQNQTQDISRSMAKQNGWSFFQVTLSFREFSNRLTHIGRMYAQDRLDHLTRHFSKTNLMCRLSQEPSFADQITSIIFARNPICPDNAGLKQGSFLRIDRILAEELFEHLFAFSDGLSLKHNQVDRFFLTIDDDMVAKLLPKTRILNGYRRPPLFFHDNTIETFDHHISEVTLMTGHVFEHSLLQQKDFERLLPTQQNEWTLIAPKLLNLFNKKELLLDPIVIQEGILKLYQYLSPEEDPTRLKTLLFSFKKFNRDHARILLWPIITSYQLGSQQLFTLLAVLDQRNLLSYFRQVYIEYALSITSLSNVLQDKGPTPVPNIFLVNFIYDNASLFKTFALHFTLYTSRWGINIKYIFFDDLNIFWNRISLKIQNYHEGDANKTQQTLKTLLKHLCCDQNGFVIKRVFLPQTILTGIEALIESSIKNHTLLEQVQEWQDLCLLETSSLYAISQNNFKLITKEMEISLDGLYLPYNPIEYDPSLALSCSYHCTYDVESNDLKKLLEAQQCDIEKDFSQYHVLKVMFFRYLGIQSLREPIQFYRQLFETQEQISDPMVCYLSHLLLGFWILTHTGAHYTRELDADRLHASFLIFLRPKNLDPKHKKTILNGVTHFCTQTKMLFSTTEPHDRCTLAQFYPFENNQSSFLSYFFSPTLETLPNSFKTPFSLATSAPFFLIHQKELEHHSQLFETQPCLLNQFIKTKMLRSFEKEALKQNQPITRIHKEIMNVLYHYFTLIVPKGSIKMFIPQCSDLEKLIQHMSILAFQKEHQIWIPDYFTLIGAHKSLSVSLLLLDLIQQCSEQHDPSLYQQILFHLITCSTLLNAEAHAKLLLPLLLKASVDHNESPYLQHIYPWINTFVQLEPQKAHRVIKTLFSVIPWRESSFSNKVFFLSHALPLSQLEQLASILDEGTFELTLLTQLFAHNPSIDFYAIAHAYKTYDKEHQQILFDIALFFTTQQNTLEDLLPHYAQYPKSELIHLQELIKLHDLSPEDLAPFLNEPSLTQTIKCLEKNLYQKNLERFNYDLNQVRQHIAQIEKRAMEEGMPNEPLNQKEQAELLTDYQTMMSYFKDKPILNQFTIHALDFEQCAFLYQNLSQQLQNASVSPQQKHQYRLMLLALLSEVYYRTRLKFPKDTQHLCAMFGMNNPRSLIKKMKTGGGKSIISALEAGLWCAQGWTLHIATENLELARVALDLSKFYYAYLHIPHAKEVITPTTPYRHYYPGGVHHSTPAYFSFFQALMALKKKLLPKHTALLCDEIDSVLTTVLQYRLAGVIDPIYLDTETWSFVLAQILKFVQENEIFLENTCDKTDDLDNFRTYVALQAIEQTYIDFIKNIPDSILDGLLNVARTPEALIDGEDYLPIKKDYREAARQYAAPILNVGTKKPEPAVSYGQGVQSLLHIYRNGLSKKQLPFGNELMTETLWTISSKNFFDTYPLVIGFTGTPGSPLELQEFKKEHELIAYDFPSFYPDRATHLETVLVDTQESLYETLLNAILKQKQESAEQPILIFMDSPKKLRAFEGFLKTQTISLDLQCYDGYEAEGLCEKDVVFAAGQLGKITLSTLSLSRGTDFETQYPLGFLAINTATDISESEYEQIKGRIGRNGAFGQFLSIICKNYLNKESFIAHQQAITKTRQNNRLKLRLLETTRAYVINDYFLKARQTAETILEQQCGMQSTLISEKEFLKTLRDFNQQSETLYLQLLNDQFELTFEQRILFFEKLVEMYQNMLEQLIPTQTLEKLEVVEPLIPLGELSSIPLPQDLKIKDLTPISTLSTLLWKAVGHQKINIACKYTDEILFAFQPYFDEEYSLQTAIANILLQRKLIEIPKVIAEIERIKQAVLGFNFQAQTTHLETQLNTNEQAQRFNIGGMIRSLLNDTILNHIKTFIIEYLKETQTKINDARWDDLSLPNLELEWIQNWVKTISSTFSYLGYAMNLAGGPIPFIIREFVIPSLITLLTTLAEKWFANSDSELAQVMNGLIHIKTDLENMIMALYKADRKTFSINDLLNNILPIFNNKAFQILLKKILAFSEDSSMFFDFIPILMQALEPLRDLPLIELQRPEHLLPLIQQFLQSNIVKNMIPEDDYAILLDSLSALPPHFELIFKDCKLPQLFSILKILAHPKLNECLLQLPPDSLMSEFKQWINTEPSLLPEPIQTPLKALYEYQNNHEKIEQETQATYHHIKQRFSLSVHHLQQHNPLFKKIKPTENPPESPPSPSWRSHLAWIGPKIIAPYVCLLIANLLFLHWSILCMGVIFLGLVTTASIHHIYKTEQPCCIC